MIESDFSCIKGIGTIILNTKDQLLVGTEMEDKPAHKRAVGMISVPIETVKPFERTNMRGLMLAGLAEVATDQNIMELKEGLHTLGIIETPVVVDPENDISAAVAVFRWIGDPERNPFLQAQTDMGDLRWMDTEELLGACELRPYAEVIIEHAKVKGYLNGHSSMPISGLDRFSPSRHAKARENHHDVSK